MRNYWHRVPPVPSDKLFFVKKPSGFKHAADALPTQASLRFPVVDEDRTTEQAIKV
jgi:hypothetical protein